MWKKQVCELKNHRLSAAQIPSSLGPSIHVQQLLDCKICQPSYRSFTHPFYREKEAASSQLAQYEKPLINLFKQVTSLICKQWLHSFFFFFFAFLCVLNSAALLLGSSLSLSSRLCSTSSPSEGRSTGGKSFSGQVERAVAPSFPWLCPLPQVWTGQGRVSARGLQVPKDSVDCFREAMKIETFCVLPCTFSLGRRTSP